MDCFSELKQKLRQNDRTSSGSYRHPDQPQERSRSILNTAAGRIGLTALVVALAGLAIFEWTAPFRRERELAAASVRQLQHLAGQDATDERVFYYLGLRERAEGSVVQAHDDLHHAAQYGIDDEDAGLALADLDESTGNFDESFSVLMQATKNHPEWARTREALASECSRRGATSLAFTEAAAAVRLAPNNANAWRLAGICALNFHRASDAEYDLRKAVQIAPNDWQNLLRLAALLASDNDTKDALPMYRKAYSLAPNEPGTTLSLGALLFTTATSPQEQAEACTMLQRAVELSPASAPAWRWLGQSYLKRSQYRQAALAYEHDVEYDPSNQEDHYRLQLIYQRLGDKIDAAQEDKKHKELVAFDQARRHLMDLIKTRPNSNSVCLQFARLCAANDDFLDAAVEYRHLAIVEPGSELIRKELATAEQNLAAHPETQQ